MTHSLDAARPRGLYAAKPAFQARLAGPADWLAKHHIHPDTLTYLALGCSIVGGGAFFAGTQQPAWLWLLPPLIFARLALNALDGMVAIRGGLARPWGKVLNELCDRLADLAFFWPLLLAPGASQPLVLASCVAILLCSYVGILSEAAGGPRQYGGPMGKADRMAWLGLSEAATALTGAYLPLQVLPAVLLVGGVFTAVER